ncbi:UNVERIFIED_CONTAM: hypothetical protein PYX00_005774 [Menopon gallinae]|uniref:Zinc finger CCHC domain-containing protein 7 n=1 Tax=Menopon gallinae TaxID=328185 RepID=A0AAW2HSQ0_9NEOP
MDRNPVVVYSDDSSDSVTEIEPPKKLPPPVIDLRDDDIVINVKGNTSQVLVETLVRGYEIPMESPGDNPSHWTNEMKKFYNDDWGNEDQFIVEKLQEKMDKRPSLWRVSEKDLHYLENKKSKSFVKCWNCCQFGHNMYKCKEPLRTPKCHMCGVSGHVENTCPNAICLNCGNQMGSYSLSCNKCKSESCKTCSRCSMSGHHFLNCSDHWRRFHSTIGKTVVTAPEKDTYKSAVEMWCCNCGRKGHYPIHCQAKKNLSFPETTLYVASYGSAFNEQGVVQQQQGNNHQQQRHYQQPGIVTKFRRKEQLYNAYPKKHKPASVRLMEGINNMRLKNKHKKRHKPNHNWKFGRNRPHETPDFIPL